MKQTILKRSLSVLTAGAILLASQIYPVANAASPPLGDVSGDLAKEIAQSYELKLIEGFSDGTFRPDLEVTKTEFALMIGRASEQASKPSQVKLDGSDPVTREEAAVVLNGVLKLDRASEPFADVPEDSEYAGVIGAISKAQLMTGYSAQKFGYGDTLTRGQAATVALRLYQYIKPFYILEASIPEIQQAMEIGKLTSLQLVQMYLTRIEKYDKEGPKLKAIITVNPKALEIAAELDAERKKSGPRGPMHGIPVVVKDNFDTADMATTAGCVCLKDSVPPKDAFQIKKLKEAGAIILAKANLHEFAFGITTQSSLGGQTLNPYALDHNPGGSSGGTGAAVAANFAVVGLGTDTGGSIRIPSSFNSLVGIRPTIGLSSRNGIIPLALTQDVGGPMARTVMDAAIILDATVGYDPEDVVTAWSIGRTPDSYTQFLRKDGLKGARIGFITQLLGSAPETATVNSTVYAAIQDMKQLGAEVIHVTVPEFDEITKYPSLSGWEFKFQLNDYLTELGPKAPYHSLTEIIHSGKFDPSQEKAMIARDARNSLNEGEYKDIVLFRTKLTQQALLKVMADQDLDAFLYPSNSQPATLIGQPQPSGGNNRLSAFSGFPAISVPAGFTKDGLPVGIEFLGRPFDEPTLIKLAYSYEQGTHHRKPPASTP